MRIVTGEIESAEIFEVLDSVGSEGCQTKHCAPSATANERFPALNAMAAAKRASWLFHSVSVKNAAELGDAAVMFVVARVKSKTSSLT
jgi:hypothetical protein